MNATIARTMKSPIGPLTIAGDGQVVTNLSMVDQTHPPRGQCDWHKDTDTYKEVVDQLRAYFDGSLSSFKVELNLIGSPFQMKVWNALLKIPYAETRSYGEIASGIGNPRAARAVGLANGLNPIAIIVPCHRVIGANGSLTGYGGGLDRKRMLLSLEQDHCPE